LLLDGDDLADAMGRVDDELVGLESLALSCPRQNRLGHGLGRTEIRLLILAAVHAAMGSLVHGGPFDRLGLGCCPLGAMRLARGPCSPAGRLLGGPFLNAMTYSSCHSARVDDHAPYPVSPQTIRKNKLPTGSARTLCSLKSHITHFQQK